MTKQATRGLEPAMASAFSTARGVSIMHQMARSSGASLAAITVCAWRTDSTFSVFGSSTASAPAVEAATRSA